MKLVPVSRFDLVNFLFSQSHKQFQLTSATNVHFPSCLITKSNQKQIIRSKPSQLSEKTRSDAIWKGRGLEGHHNFTRHLSYEERSGRIGSEHFQKLPCVPFKRILLKCLNNWYQRY